MNRKNLSQLCRITTAGFFFCTSSGRFFFPFFTGTRRHRCRVCRGIVHASTQGGGAARRRGRQGGEQWRGRQPDRKNCVFTVPYSGPWLSIADELQFKQRRHIVQMPDGGGSASLFSGASSVLAAHRRPAATRGGDSPWDERRQQQSSQCCCHCLMDVK